MAAAAPGPRIEIGRVILQNAAIAFTDRSITPNYATELTGLSVEIGKLCFLRFDGIPRVPKGMPSSRCCCRPVPGAPLGGSEITMLAGSP